MNVNLFPVRLQFVRPPPNSLYSSRSAVLLASIQVSFSRISRRKSRALCLGEGSHLARSIRRAPQD